MQIVVPVNQAECLRLGIDAPASSVSRDLDPALLSQSQRDVLAAILQDGHKVSLTAHYIQSFNGKNYVAQFSPIAPATFEAFAAELERMHAYVAKQAADEAAKREREVQEILELPIAKHIKAGSPGFARDGKVLGVEAPTVSISGGWSYKEDKRVLELKARVESSAEFREVMKY